MFFSLNSRDRSTFKKLRSWKGVSSSLLSLAIALTAARNAMAEDPIAQLQEQAATSGVSDWAHWGPNPDKYSSWLTHSNRLVPVYVFGASLEHFCGERSVYRDPQKLAELYGSLPADTLNPHAEYCDQTDVFRLQRDAIEAGKKKVVLFVFDGMDWQTSRAASIAKLGRVAYDQGRGTGLAFQDYDKAETDFGFFVSSPHNNGTNVDVNRQRVTNIGGKTPGGYSPALGGSQPWDEAQANAEYLTTQYQGLLHAYTDSASSATSLTSGIKTYNNAINVDPAGREVLPLARLLQEQGFAVGAVSSVPISHATPACAYANNVHRSDYQDITRDMLGLPSVFHPGGLLGMDVVLGAGWGENEQQDGAQGENYEAGNRYIADGDLHAIDIEHGGKYVVAKRTAHRLGQDVLAEATQRAVQGKHRLFALFGVAGGHLPFQTADGGYNPVSSVGNPEAARPEEYSRADIEENPTLADLAISAMDVLEAKSDRWWLMVEPGDVDWASHSNNIDNAIGAVLSGEYAFQRVTQWIEEHGGWDDAVVIVTADHGHYLVLDQPERLAQQSANPSN